MLNNYSTKLQKVMETLPLNKLSPPFKASGAAMLSKNFSSRTSRNSGKHSNKTFFKGATSFVIQAESSMRIQENDQAIRSYLGIDNEKA